MYAHAYISLGVGKPQGRILWHEIECPMQKGVAHSLCNSDFSIIIITVAGGLIALLDSDEDGVSVFKAP